MSMKKGCCCRKEVIAGLVIGFGVFIICLGAASIPLFEDLYVKAVKKQLVLKKGSEAYNNWLSPPTPVYMQYYVFNYTNVADIIANKSKPSVQQLGPYSYRELHNNKVLEFTEDEITYLQNYSYVFDLSSSCATCNESDVVFTPNIPVLTILKYVHKANITEDSGFFTKLGVKVFNIFLGHENVGLFHKLTVKKLLWGYKDDFLSKMEAIEKLLEVFGAKLPPIDSFVALQHNGTSGAELVGNLTISTGKQNIDDVQKVLKWRGVNHTNITYWRTKYGRMLNGTDGTHFKPFLPRHQTVYIFTADLSRSLYIVYEKDRFLRDILLYRHSTPEKLFLKRELNPDNGAFCGPDRCWGTGLLPIGQCQAGNPPIFMSGPHFYQGNKTLVEAIDGMHPNKTLHATFIDVEPTTGIAMEAHKRLQVNVLAQPTPFIEMTDSLRNPDNFLPVLFLHEMAVIDKASADRFKSEVLSPKKMLNIIQYCLLAVGLAIVVGAVLFITVKQIARGNKYQKFNDEVEEEKII